MESVTTYYLEMCAPSELKAKPHPGQLDVVECEVKQFQVNRFLYAFVGEAWEWQEKLTWSDEKWREWVESENHRTWIAHRRGSIAGYYELQKQATDVEILYFGLTPAFIGQGLGGYLLTHAIQSAWAWPQTERVWVHTCTLDHPRALTNYQARGFKLYDQETERV